MTAAEADQAAAVLVLDLLSRARCELDRSTLTQTDMAAIEGGVLRIEAWLRRRAVGNDRFTVQRMERPTGGKVGMSSKQARKLGIPDGTNRKP